MAIILWCRIWWKSGLRKGLVKLLAKYTERCDVTMSKQSKVRVTGAMFASDSHNVRSTSPAKENAKRAPFTAAYFGSLRIRLCINKEYPQSPFLSRSLPAFNFTAYPQPNPPTPLFLLDALNSLVGSRVSTLRAPPLLETMRLSIAFAIPRFHRASRAHILLLTSSSLSL